METLKTVLIPSEVRSRTTDISDYSRPELLAHLYVANLLGDDGRRINDFTIRDMRVESGRCVMRCFMTDDGKWYDGDVDGLKIAHCDAELKSVNPDTDIERDGASQMIVSVPIHVLREIEERLNFAIKMITRDILEKTGKIIRDIGGYDKIDDDSEEEELRLAA